MAYFTRDALTSYKIILGGFKVCFICFRESV